MRSLRFSSETLLLFAVLALAFGLRIVGIQFGLPYLYHADEPIVVNHALAFGGGDLNPHFFKIPPLVSYLLFGVYGIYFLLGRLCGVFPSIHEFEQLFYTDPTSFYLIARVLFGAFLGTLSVYALYRMAKRFWSMETALLAGLFFATCFLHVRDSHYIYADIPLVLVLILGFIQILKLSENPERWPLHLKVGVLIGLAVATKYNGIFLVLPYFWICIRQLNWKKWVPVWLLTACAVLGVFFLLNPYALLDRSFFLRELLLQSQSNQGVSWWHYLTYSLPGALGGYLLLVSLLGVGQALMSRDPKNEAVAVYALGYYAVLCYFGQPYDRYVLPLLPFLILLAANFLGRLRYKPLIYSAAIFLILPPLLTVMQFNRIMLQEDVRTVAKKWIEQTIPEGRKIALDWEFYAPRLAFTEDQLEEKWRLLDNAQELSASKKRRLAGLLANPYHPAYQLSFMVKDPSSPRFLFAEPTVPFDLKALKKYGVEYVVLVDPIHSDDDPFVLDLKKNGTVSAAFSPYFYPQSTRLDPLPLTGGPFVWRDIFSRQRNGYSLTIYKIR